MSTKRIIITSVCILAIVASLWQKETLSVLANRLLATERVAVQEQNPEVETEAIKILEIQETADFSLTLPVVAENNETEMQPVRFVYQGQQVETEEMPALQPIEVHQYTWEEFNQASVTFADFNGLVLGDFEQPLELSWQQEDELSRLSQQAFPVYATPTLFQVEKPLTLQEPTTDLNLIVQMIETKQVPKITLLGLPKEIAKNATQKIYFQVLVEHPSTEPNLSITAKITGDITNSPKPEQQKNQLVPNNVEYFEFIEIAAKTGAVQVEVTATILGQTTTVTQVLPYATNNQYYIINERLWPNPDVAGYLYGDELKLKRDVTITAGNESRKICQLSSKLRIGNQIIDEIENIDLGAGVNPTDINAKLAEIGQSEYVLNLPLNLTQEGKVIIESEVIMQVAQGNTCDKNYEAKRGSGISVINIRKGQLKVEFVDYQTQQLITQPYHVAINIDKLYPGIQNPQNNTTGQLVFSPLKTARADQYEATLTIPPTVMLRYRELLKTEIFNSDNSLGSLPAQLRYSNPVITVRYHFGPINPLDGAITLGLDNNQFQLTHYPQLTVATNSFLTLGAEFKLKEKPDALLITVPQKGTQPVMYQKTTGGLHVPLTSLNLIDWTYDEAAKQWRGIPKLKFYDAFPNIKTAPETFFIRWSVQMPNTGAQVGIQIEPGPVETHKQLIPLTPYIEAENQGSATLPDLF